MFVHLAAAGSDDLFLLLTDQLLCLEALLLFVALLVLQELVEVAPFFSRCILLNRLTDLNRAHVGP